jgi:putative hydrolase of HD superfamily
MSQDQEDTKEDTVEARRLADFVYEVGMLQRTERSGFWFLGSGSQNVAAHSFRTAVIAYALAEMEGDVDSEHVAVMALFHDLGEARTADLNYVHQKYNVADNMQAITDACDGLPFGEKVVQYNNEMKDRVSKASQIVKDADNLELLAMLRDEQEKGNQRAADWIPSVVQRIYTSHGKKLAEGLCAAHPDDWWFDRGAQWWVDRNKK